MMADDEEREENTENTARGNEWEVVSLTASAYAAAPGPKGIELKDGDKDKGYEAESSHALFMSNHFIFPPSQHENLPLEPESSEILDEAAEKDVSSEHGVEEGGKSGGKDEENWPLKDMNISDEFPGMQFLDEKVNKLSISGTEFDESTALQELSIHDKEQSIYSATTFSSFHSETGLGGSATYGDNMSISDVNEASEKSVDLSTDISHSPKPAKDVTYDGSGLPCEAWWKRRAASLYSHAKETNSFWSFFVAAAVMGLVILGHRWQQERWRSVQLKWHSSINESWK
ncbi:ATG8-interacting protein 1 isoform X2 [Euphorbia lathyris]|uniref:ATG8-interacting protein 1 isoform X2 n=1 Tax=Euphorbia lathyris TaxID=212925 RepID=UPI003314269B